MLIETVILEAIVALIVSFGMMNAAVYGRYPSLDYTKKVMLVACEPETAKMTDEQQKWFDTNGWKIIFTGVGKVNAAIAATTVRWCYKNASVIVNVGTCGSQTHPKGALVVPDKVAERDMDTTVIMRQFIPDWPKHLTPTFDENGDVVFDKEKIFGKIDLSNFVLPDGVRAIVGGMVGTGDNTHAHLEESDFVWDCVEMELAAIVAALVKTNWQGRLLSMKIVTDSANKDAGKDWAENADSIRFDDVIKIFVANNL